MELKKTPKVAGILSIISGIIGLLGSPVMIAYSSIALLDSESWYYLYYTGLLFIPIGIVAIVGGIFSLRRKIWGLAFAGVICAIICFLFLGIPAIIFIARSKGEFV